MKYPIFLQHGYSLIKILDESTYIDVANDSYDTGIMEKKLAPNVVKMMLKDGKQITEQTYNDGLLQALSHLNQLTFMAGNLHINDLENVMI